MVDPISSRLDSEAVAGQNATSWFERSIPAQIERPMIPGVRGRENAPEHRSGVTASTVQMFPDAALVP